MSRRARISHILRVARQANVRATSLELALERLTTEVADLRSLIAERPESYGGALSRLEATQALVARTYEAGFDWPAHLEEVRAAPHYDAAWEDNEPLVTVRVATFNNAKVLTERTLASVLGQTYTNWEAIVVGDACTDDTEQRIAALAEPRIRFENLATRGPYPADPTALWFTGGIPPSNRGLDLARGAWIAAIDHDDAWEADHIEVLLAGARQTRAEIVYGRWRMVDEAVGRTFDHLFGGVYPPVDGSMGFQASLVHGGLRRFHYDMNCFLAGEPGDRNLTRRLWESGVRFAAIEDLVLTYWFAGKNEWGQRYLEELRRDHRYLDPS